MSRPLRVELAGGVYYLTARGDGREEIFLDEDDRWQFPALVRHTMERFGWHCLAYCLMTNYYHLLAETPAPNLTRGMRHLNGVYTQRFNRRHGRVGHGFQGRYQAIVVQKDAQLLGLGRSVVLNSGVRLPLSVNRRPLDTIIGTLGATSRRAIRPQSYAHQFYRSWLCPHE